MHGGVLAHSWPRLTLQDSGRHTCTRLTHALYCVSACSFVCSSSSLARRALPRSAVNPAHDVREQLALSASTHRRSCRSAHDAVRTHGTASCCMRRDSRAQCWPRSNSIGTNSCFSSRGRPINRHQGVAPSFSPRHASSTGLFIQPYFYSAARLVYLCRHSRSINNQDA